ncbi:Uncharacterized 2Fe-2 and 4Fe-4S clusters-containing protein, contains DUF4445 domain [Desulfocicer vacuolatum DSM 3385]|uniref:Uncharacterized 2Fe-2 and 4Fe-4S clusters-containing protein, contains DUF4445 domain n=1 Tax=Desulfocicer vacuolatum DSM 3385 TaxID=1121400 RepID=A0A1W1YL92_9BACT|nr:ASKHA domain-containing protein [Desulfocicer vacuolatum]SMC36914.1 Uncharacterized 2Fe-2 and 4Fe-4S clusters-containing protein, contains DUF4445 domain [Desulfocicer vacuolatum DSM 3385]
MTTVENINGFVRTIQVKEPRLGNNTADVERLVSALSHDLEQKGNAPKDSSVYFPPHLVPDLARQLRQWGHCIKVVLFKDSRGWRVIAVIDPELTQPVCGVAADLGTTRVVLRLVNLETGANLGELGFDNPQIALGPDVLTRIHHARDPKGLEQMQALIIDGMNRHIKKLVHAAGLGVESVYLFTGAGNTAMTHLFLGIEPSFIIREPYIPAVNAPESMAAGDAGLGMHPHGMVFLFPNIGSYFGGDLIAGILFAQLHKKENPCLMVDVGTNAEVVVGNRDWLMACAGAAGPALEGGISDMGMTAGPGVIDRVSIDIDTLEIDLGTIENKPPVGICGSGMIDLAAQLFLSGMVDIRGKFSPERCGERLFEKDEIQHLCLVKREDSGTGREILFSQVDLNSLTSAKAAMHSILEVIVRQTAGLSFEELEKFYVAGTFGSFIDPRSAISIGMLPDMPLDKFEVLGNSSLGGAARLLVDPHAFEEIRMIGQSITYIELNVNQSFMNTFSGAKFYPHTDRSLFPSVSIYGG